MLKKALDEINLKIAHSAFEKFDKFTQIMLDYNKNVNLTRITQPEDIAVKHYADSLSPLLTGLFFEKAKVIDVGCGAGFPSFPLKFARDDLNVCQVDSLRKRVDFLNKVHNELSLNNIEAIHARAEELARKDSHREAFDIAVSRAVADLKVLAELVLPFVKIGGYFIALKGRSAEQELEDAKGAIKILGGSIEKVMPIEFKDYDTVHNLIIIKKISAISPKYPRNSAKISKSPLK